MQKTLLLLISLLLSVTSLKSQTDKAEYGATQFAISGVAITTTGTVYSFEGPSWIGGPPDTLSLVNENELVPQMNSPIGSESKADVYWNSAENMYYLVELNYPLGCEAPYDRMDIVSFPKDDPNDVSRVEVIGPGLRIGQSPDFVASGNRFAIRYRDTLVTSSFLNPFDTVVTILEEETDPLFPSKMIIIGDDIHVADGTELLTIDTNDVVTKMLFNEPLLGLGTHGFTNLDVYVVTTVAGYRISQGSIIDTVDFEDMYTFRSLVMNKDSRGFLCTYSEDGGPLRYGLESGVSNINITSFTTVDSAATGFFSEYLRINTSEGGNARSVAVLKYSGSSIVMTTQNAVEFVDLDEIDVEMVSLDLILDSERVYIAPTIQNNSNQVLESLQFSGNVYGGVCFFLTRKSYGDLGIQPGETRRLDSFSIQSYDRTGNEYFARLRLNTANNFPIKPGNARDSIATAILSSTQETYVKSISVYPNPAKATVQVELEAGESIQEVRAMDVQGRNLGLIPFSTTTLDLSPLAKGNYLLEIRLVGGETRYSSLLKE